MQFKLSRTVKVGEKIRTELGWRKVLKVNEHGIVTREQTIRFGDTILGWKRS